MCRSRVGTAGQIGFEGSSFEKGGHLDRGLTTSTGCPTPASAANPTLTNVALATRQADHIRREMNARNL
ncbi:MAG: hypothetical protein QOK35_618 [Pseudonocardiales bacterium]|nr:hypothetical protein [Pseudonocardiales bacterium]